MKRVLGNAQNTMKFAGGEIRENWLILAYSAFVTTEI